jgi:hypothetical protein
MVQTVVVLFMLLELENMSLELGDKDIFIGVVEFEIIVVLD